MNCKKSLARVVYSIEMTIQNQGATENRYSVNMRTLCFLTRDNQVLLIRGALDKRLWAGLYNGIGGHVEAGEDVYSACLRELEEETGIKVSDIHLCGIITIDSSKEVGVCIFVFRGECQHGDPRPSTEGSVEWVALREIHHLPLVPDLYELLPRVINKSVQAEPFFAQYSYNEGDEMVIKFLNQ